MKTLVRTIEIIDDENDDILKHKTMIDAILSALVGLNLMSKENLNEILPSLKFYGFKSTIEKIKEQGD